MTSYRPTSATAEPNTPNALTCSASPSGPSLPAERVKPSHFRAIVRQQLVDGDPRRAHIRPELACLTRYGAYVTHAEETSAKLNL